MADRGTDDNNAAQIAKWVVDRAIGGVTIGETRLLASSGELADEYRRDSKFSDDEARIDALIRWEVTKNFSSGFVTSLDGAFNLPVAVSKALAASWVLQSRMAAAIASLRGYDVNEDRVRTFVLLALIADSIEEVLSKVGVKVGQKVAERLIEQIPGRVLIEINKQVGFRLLTKAGETGVVNLVKVVPPIVGGVVSGAFDGATCWGVGKAAKLLFPATIREPQEFADTASH